MNPILNQNAFFVKEHVGLLKAANNYDVLDPANGQTILHCREDRLGFFTKILRFTDYKRMTPFDVEINTPPGEPVVRVKRGVSFFLSKVSVFNEKVERIGGFKQKFFSLGGKFTLMDARGESRLYAEGQMDRWDLSS